jgi:glutamate dehydrogenase
VAERDPLDLYGLALGHFNFARERAPGTPKVRAYNPRFEEHGWQSTHTAVEIVTDDMPFLIDSVSMELNRAGCGVHLIIHPVLAVRRDAQGCLTEILPQADPLEQGAIGESVIHAEVARQSEPAKLREIEQSLERVIAEVRCAVEDWQAMRGQALEAVAEVGEDDPEAAAFLDWLADDNFTFLGYRDAEGTGLGILRDSQERDPSVGLSSDSGAITLTKAN